MGSLWDGEICRSSAAIARIALIGLLGCGSAPPAPPPAIGNSAETGHDEADPQHIAGRWAYRTRSSCGTEEGHGWVSFVWDGAEGHYEERGEVTWPVEHITIGWEGTARFDPETGRIDADLVNTLGDAVRGGWVLEGEGPDRMTTEWEQSNGCTGIGIAMRPLDR
jgi:hypothetical protein